MIKDDQKTFVIHCQEVFCLYARLSKFSPLKQKFILTLSLLNAGRPQCMVCFSRLHFFHLRHKKSLRKSSRALERHFLLSCKQHSIETRCRAVASSCSTLSRLEKSKPLKLLTISIQSCSDKCVKINFKSNIPLFGGRVFVLRQSGS